MILLRASALDARRGLGGDRPEGRDSNSLGLGPRRPHQAQAGEKDGGAEAVYRRFRERGRMLPAGLEYVDSWTADTFDRCFQLMECEDTRLLAEWVARWEDLVEFEIVPVVSSGEAASLVARRSP